MLGNEKFFQKLRQVVQPLLNGWHLLFNGVKTGIKINSWQETFEPLKVSVVLHRVKQSLLFLTRSHSLKQTPHWKTN